MVPPVPSKSRCVCGRFAGVVPEPELSFEEVCLKLLPVGEMFIICLISNFQNINISQLFIPSYSKIRKNPMS